MVNPVKPGVRPEFIKEQFLGGAASAAGALVVTYAAKELQSDDPFGLYTGGKTARAIKATKIYIQDEVKSDDPFGLKTGGKTARVLKGEEDCSIM